MMTKSCAHHVKRSVPTTCHGLSGMFDLRLSWYMLLSSISALICFPIPGQKKRSHPLCLFFFMPICPVCICWIMVFFSELVRYCNFLTFEEYAFNLRYLISVVPVLLDIGWTFSFNRSSDLYGSVESILCHCFSNLQQFLACHWNC